MGMKSLTTTFCILCVITWLVILSLPAASGAESARSLVDKGNELYGAGSYDEALKAYEEAAQLLPESGEVSFNKGNGYFRKGDYQKAREAYEAAALHAGDPSLEAKSQFNLGNVAFAESEELLKENMQKALDRYGLSIRHYQNALRIDPNLEQAAENIEMARLRVKDLLDQIKNQEEEAKERQKQQEELKKQLEEAVREQESEIADNDSLREKMAQDPRYPGESFRDETEKLASDQSATREKTEKIAQQLKGDQDQVQKQSAEKEHGDVSPQTGDAELPTADEHDAKHDIAEHLESALGAQDSALDGIGKSDLDGAKDNQEKALQELKQALSKLEDAKENPAEKRDKTGDGQQGQQGEQEQQDKPKEQAGDQTEQQSAGQDQKQDQEQGGQANQQDSASPDAGQAQRQNREKAEGHQQKSPQSGKEGEDRKAAAILREKPEDILKEERENRLQLERSHKGAYRPAEKDW
jgi:tetratricopeptide (TPR) repeat protein